jgi:beta-glucosidase/6-phospho-beta-glucosidase/beta-galactosidase
MNINPLYPYCVNQGITNAYGWDIGYASESYVYITPTYLRPSLVYVWNSFKTPITLTEFGFPIYGESARDLQDQLFDSPRSQYYLSFLSELLRAIVWTWADNWEFGAYTAQFGMQTVNRTTQERHLRRVSLMSWTLWERGADLDIR